MPALLRKHVDYSDTSAHRAPPPRITPSGNVFGWSKEQKAFLAANWPRDGVPDYAWLSLNLGKKRGAISMQATKQGLRQIK